MFVVDTGTRGTPTPSCPMRWVVTHSTEDSETSRFMGHHWMLEKRFLRSPRWVCQTCGQALPASAFGNHRKEKGRA